jgi:hypothetical protein
VLQIGLNWLLKRGMLPFAIMDDVEPNDETNLQ